MSKEFAERLEKPAKKSGEAAGKAISDGLGSSVENLERQVKASSSKLQDLDRAYEKSASKQAAQKEKVEAATLKLQDAEEKYQSALESGDKGLAELAKVKEAKARLIGETEKLEQAEINTRVAEEKHKNQLDDLQSTLSRYDQAQGELADQLGATRQELSEMGGEFSDLDAAMEDSSNKAEGWGSRFANMLSPLGKLGGIAVGIAGVNSLAGTLQAGFEKVTSIEDTTASLGILMGSAEEAAKVMGELEESNQNTPYSFDAWAGAGKNLIAFGVEAEKTSDIVTALGEAASASGKGEEALNSMADAFGKAAASGKISMDTINSLSQGGVQGLTILANEFGVTTEEMQKMISSGQVSAEEGIDALTKGIREGSEGIAGDVASMSGVMGEMAETTSGRLTNMKAAFNNAAKAGLEELNPLIGEAAEKMTDWTYAGIDLFKTYMVPAIHDGVDAAKNVMETIKPALGVTRDVLKSVVGWLKDSAEWILKNKDWISSLALSVGVLVGAYKMWAQWQKIMAAGGFVKWIMSGVKATKLWTSVTKIAAAAQKALNAVMKANPIGLIITAITALVAGLTWFFTKTETGKELWSQFMEVLRSGWDSVKEKMSGFFDWAKGLWDRAVEKFGEAREAMAPIIETVQEIAQVILDRVVGAFSWLAEKVVATFTTVSEWIGTFLTFLQENFWPVVESILGFVGDAFTALWDGLSWAWENVIQPVFNGIWELAQVTLAVIGTVILTPLLIAWNLLSSAIQWAWENVIQPVWQALSDFAMNTLWPALQSVFQFIKDAFQAVGDGIKWVWENIIKPTWDALVQAAQWLWNDVLMPVFDAIRNGFQALGDGIRWVWDNIIKPVWDVFAAVLGWLWNDVVAFYVNLIKDAWNGLGTSIRWVYDNVIKPAWDAFASALNWLWDSVVSPVVSWIEDKWDAMGRLFGRVKDFIVDNVFGGIQSGLDTLKGWFNTVVGAIEDIWNRVKRITAKPARFVVETVYNNGIRKAWNAVAKFTGLDELQPAALGDLGAYARGGVLPGYTPGKDVHQFYSRTGGRVDLSGGEAIMRPEWVRAMGGKAAIDAMNKAAISGGVNGVRNLLGSDPGSVQRRADGGVLAFKDGGLFPNGDTDRKEGQSAAIQRALAFMRREAGKPYQWGGVGNPSWDCSGLWSGIVHELNGNDGRSGRLFNTNSLIANPGTWGFKPGLSGPVTVGVSTDHMAGTLSGLNAESRSGDGVLLGGSAWGSENGYFPYKYTLASILGEYLPGAEGGGGGFNLGAMVKGIWDGIIDKLPKFDGAATSGLIGRLPAEMLKKLATSAWDFVKEKIGAFFGAGGQSGNAESWREMAMWAMRRTGFNADDPAQVNAMLAQIQSESGGIPDRNQEIVDVNGTGASAGQGLLQIIPGTFAAHRDPELPNDRTDPQANMVAALRYYRSQYGDDLTTMWGHGHGYASGGVVELSKLYDQGGWLPHGGVAQNLSGKPEPVFTASQWSSISDMIRTLGDLVPAIKGQTEVIARAVDDAQGWLAKAGDYNSIEGINARQGVRRMLDLGLDLPGSDIVKMVLDGEDTLWDSRARAAKHLDAIVEKEEALEEARKAVADLNDKPEGVSKEDQEKIDEARKALDDAKSEKAKAESEEDRAKAAEKVTEAEKKLKEVREEVDKNSEENAKKHAEEVTKANEAVSKAEQELADARKKQAMDLDNVVLMSQGQIKGMIPQAKQLADQLIGMGAPAQAVNAGLAQVTGQLARMAGFAGPAGITLGMAMDMLKVGIGIIKAIVGAIEDLIAKIRKARLDALKALADGWSVIADYAKLIVDLQGKVTSLQQALIRGANAQREAEYNLMLAQQDRYIAEAEGALKVAEARLALDAEIKRGATIAQLKLMGLHEDWDSYMAYQALEAQGVLEEWSNSAISALFTYEKARAEALKGEVTARLEQIKAEAALAEAQRQNVRNQQDLLKAQERLIRMSAKVAGVDLVEATGTAQVAKLMAEMAEVKQAMDKNVLGRWGVGLGANGSFANEYRGQQAQYNSLQQALDAVLAETGVQIDRGNLDRVLTLMGRAAYRGGDPTAVLRAQLPELAQAETALKINESLKPVYDARDQRDDLARKVEDFTAEIDLYEKTTPLEHTLKGLDYTIKSLEQSSQAWAEGNEELRGEYLAAAKANRDAAEAAGVDWKLDAKYANAGVRDQIRRETTIYLDGEKVYTADQIDQLLAEVTAGTNGSYRIVRSASEVAVARRKERV
ncbi:tape measure protein [Corynebacterium sp. 11254D000AR]